MKNALIALLFLGTALSASAHASSPEHIAQSFSYRAAPTTFFQATAHHPTLEDFSSPAILWVDFDLLARHLTSQLCPSSSAKGDRWFEGLVR